MRNSQIKWFVLISLIFVYFERLNLDPRDVYFQVEVETKIWDKKLVMAGKNNETVHFCSRISPLYNLSQQGYGNFLHNQTLSKTASPRILEGRVNQIDVSNTNNIFTPPFALVNLEEDLPEQDFDWGVENEFIQEKFRFCKGFEAAAKTATTNTSTTTTT